MSKLLLFLLFLVNELEVYMKMDLFFRTFDMSAQSFTAVEVH